MKKTTEADSKELQVLLENLELPEVHLPAHQRRLREILLAPGGFKKESVLFLARQKISGGINGMKPQAWKLAVASIAVLFLAVGGYLTFFTAPQAVAGIDLQINPALTLTIGERNSVIDAEGLDAQGESLLAGLDVANKEMTEVLRKVAGALREAGLLENERRVLIALHPVGDRVEETKLADLADTVRQILADYLAEHELTAEVVIVVLTVELAEAIRATALFPADYVDLVVAVGARAAVEALNLQRELNLDPALFKEEFGTIAAALIDMAEAGIAGENALAILRGALASDPKMEELATIIAAMIDLHEAGATQEDILAVFVLVEEQLAKGVERKLLLEEFATITAAKADLLEAGIPAATALAALRTALQADPTLEELSTITAAMIDLVEKGLSEEAALAKIRAAIKADPTLQNFDDFIEVPDEVEGDNGEEGNGFGEAVRPRLNKQQPDQSQGQEPADTSGDENNEEN